MSFENYFWVKTSTAGFMSFENCRKHCEGSHQGTRNWRANHVGIQSTVGKKMAAVHFTTMPCEPNTAYKTQRKPNFTIFFPVLRTLSSLGLKIL